MSEADLNPVQRAIVIAGSERKLAEAACVSQPAINKAKRVGRVSAKLAKKIDEVTNGQVPRWELCPDVFDAPASETEAA